MTAAAAAVPAGARQRAADPQGPRGELRIVQRRRVRPVPIPAFPDRPARAELARLLRVEQNQLGMTQEGYADHYGVSRSTVSRFLQGRGKLTALFRLNLRAQHPEWSHTIDEVVREDARRAEAVEARRARLAH